LQDLSDKIKKNIESRAEDENFGWLKYEFFILFEHCLFFFCELWRAMARALYFQLYVRGRNFESCRCSKLAVSHLENIVFILPFIAGSHSEEQTA